MKVAIMASLLTKWNMKINAAQELRFSPHSYRDYNLDLNINEKPSKKILVLLFDDFILHQ